MTHPLSLPVQSPLLTLTHPKPSLWVIEIHNGVDNRLSSALVGQGFKPALDTVERDWREQQTTAKKNKDKNGGKGSLIIVGRKDQDKFFSNGLDFEKIVGDVNFFPLIFNPLLSRLMTFPIPTIAAINGHCFAGGFMLTIACDYRVMTDGSKRNAWLCMNEIHFGAPWPLSFASILRAKVGDHRLHRKIALEGYRFTPLEALEAGLLDRIVTGNTTDIMAAAEDLADSVSVNAKEGVWGVIKGELYRDTLEVIERDAAAKAKL